MFYLLYIYFYEYVPKRQNKTTSVLSDTFIWVVRCIYHLQCTYLDYCQSMKAYLEHSQKMSPPEDKT